MSHPSLSFEDWFAETLGQPTDQVKRLLDDPTAMHFLMTWSIFESRCFGGFMRAMDINAFAQRSAEAGFNTAMMSDHHLHFFQRYQDPGNRHRLHHVHRNVAFDSLLQQERGSLSAEQWVYLIVYVVFRFRNNIFHGNKGVASWLVYGEQIRRCIEVMQAFISFAEAAEPRLRLQSAPNPPLPRKTRD